MTAVPAPPPTRPRRALLAVGAALALALAACGGEDEEPAPAASGDAAASDGFPLTLESEFGTTEVPAAPERVVSLGITDVDALLALGVTPVALQQFVTDYPSGVGPWSADALGDAEPEVLTDPEVDLEQVAALDPDLIVAVQSGIDQALFDQLSQIAPVVARPPGSQAYGVSMEDQTLTIARAVGQEEEGQRLVDEVESALDDAAAANPAFAETQAVPAAAFPGPTYYVYTEGDARARFLTSLGFARPPALADLENGTFTAELSPERLDLLEGDLLLLLDYSQDPTALSGDPVLSGLDVVSRGDALIVQPDPVGNALSYNTVASVPFALERVLPDLAAAVE